MQCFADLGQSDGLFEPAHFHTSYLFRENYLVLHHLLDLQYHIYYSLYFMVLSVHTVLSYLSVPHF